MPSLQSTPDVPLDDLYVGQSISRQYLSPENEPAENDLLNPVQVLLENRCMVVLGDPGSGKSTLINWFAWYLASGFENRLPNGLANALPLPIILRELSLNHVTSFSDLLDEALKRPVAEHLDRQTLYNYINNGSVLFLVDGLDELSIESRNCVIEALGEGMENLSQSFFLITSRVVGYEGLYLKKLVVSNYDDPYINVDTISSETDVESLVSWGEIKLSISHDKNALGTFYIAPFSDKQISQFSFNWYREQMDGVDVSARLLRDQFISSIFSDDNTRRLSRTPHLLTMMALIFRKRAHLPNGRAILYDAIAQAYLESIDQARGLKDEYDWQSKKLWLAKVAFEMQLQRSSEDDNEELLVDKHIVLNWIKESINSYQYQVDDKYSEEFLSWIARRSGLLLPRGQEQYAFLHLSFQEYFSAVYIQSQLENPSWIDKEDEQTLDRRVDIHTLARWANELSWNQTLIFLFELMSKKAGWSKRIWRYIFRSEQYTSEISNWIENIYSTARPPLVDLKWSLLSNRHCHVDYSLQHDEFSEVFSHSAKEQNEANGVSELYGLESLQNIILASDKGNNDYIEYLDANYYGNSFNVSNVDLSLKENVLKFLGRKAFISNLTLYNCNIVETNFLCGMPKLERLFIGSNRIERIQGGNYFALLKNADLSNNNLSSIEFLKYSDRLVSLDLRENKIYDFSVIGSFEKLKSLHIDAISEDDSILFDGLKNLLFLSVKAKSQIVIEKVFDCQKLFNLNISGSDISSIENIHKLKNLKTLHAENLTLDSWRPILDIPNLGMLSIDNSAEIDKKIINTLKERNVKIRIWPRN
jgi:internalin A